MCDITTQSDFWLIEALWLHLATYIWVNIGSCTLTSWIIVYIRVFMLRKFSDLYGLIWVYTLIWISPFHPIQILFKSIRFTYGGNVNKDVKFPPKISFTKSTESKSHHDYAGNWPSFCWKHTYLSLRWPLHMVNQIFYWPAHRAGLLWLNYFWWARKCL